MKTMSVQKIILLIIGIVVGLGAATMVIAQPVQGVITFEVRVNMHRTIPKEREEMKNMIPEFRTSMQELYFNEKESLYKPVEDDEEDIEGQNGGVHIRMRQPKVKTYVNTETLAQVTQQDFMGKDYLIEDTLKILPWKFGTELKTIMGKECKQAFYHNEERKQDVVAWYAPGFRPLLGPEVFGSLPGAVLEVNINDGERVVTAKSLDVRALKKNELKAPKDGTKITRHAFRKMADEQMERMRANGSNVIIRN
jgi:GLPGLI family protein